MSRWKCILCGYVYDSEKGEPDEGIEPGIKFEDLPDSYKCPMCSASKDMFKEIP
ncbi:MAG: rubredoxin [Methanobrevibacter sp.]|nr:rubredoxin [Methanobrevibacter sp.]